MLFQVLFKLRKNMVRRTNVFEEKAIYEAEALLLSLMLFSSPLNVQHGVGSRRYGIGKSG